MWLFVMPSRGRSVQGQALWWAAGWLVVCIRGIWNWAPAVVEFICTSLLN